MRPSLLLALLLVLPGTSALAASTSASHSANANNWHCCWDNFYKYDAQSGSGNVSALAWFANARAGGAASFGHITGSAVADAPFPEGGYTQSEAGGRVRDVWSDDFTIVSSSLTAGTPVQVQVWLSVGADLYANLGSGGWASAEVTSALHFDGQDNPWITGVSFKAGDISGANSISGGSEVVTATFASAVGAHFTLVNDLVVNASAGGAPKSPREALAKGVAAFGMQVLTAGAGHVSASNTSYVPGPVALVPEPGSYALMLAGLVGVAVVARRRTLAQSRRCAIWL
ncbi:PEP-CTERM sorting domain-containing protein [Roseateles paludis]|uniref:PEP-CTERM sorting domain-containing protein n=1 Tax=Roseateles paludis TaxID=3145238 RepID=A0ABV0FYB8_9BURK